MEAEQPPEGERAFWINFRTRQLGSRVLRRLRVRSPREEVPAVTYIAAEEIDALSDATLKEALRQQLEAKQDPEVDMPIPIAWPDGRYVGRVVVQRVQKGTQ